MPQASGWPSASMAGAWKLTTRDVRYAALADLAAHAGAGHLLLAHHQDDQAETVLLRLLRGTGPLGLAAMRPVTERAGLVWIRPWLDQPRSAILDCARRFEALSGWRPVRRSQQCRCPLRPCRPARRTGAGAGRALAGLAPYLAGMPSRRGCVRLGGRNHPRRLDRAGPGPDGRSFSLAAWRALQTRHAPLLRHWLLGLGLRMPTEARLRAWLRSLREVHALGHDRDLRLLHEDVWIVVRRGRVLCVAKTRVE